MSKKITAITESGADYVLVDGFVYHRGYNMGKVWGMKSAPADVEVMPWGEGSEVWADVIFPVVGERLYVRTRNEWRITTPIVSITEEENEDD